MVVLRSMEVVLEIGRKVVKESEKGRVRKVEEG